MKKEHCYPGELFIVKLASLSMGLDVIRSFIIGIGVYLGFSLNPVFVIGNQPGQGGIHGVIPIGMPSIEDIKLPLSYLSSDFTENWWMAILFLIIGVIIDSIFLSGYLGGIHSKLVSKKSFSFRGNASYYFRRMLGWSVINWIAILIGGFLTIAFWPIAILLFIGFFIFSLTPYLIVLQDLSVIDSLGRSPRYFKRYFWKFVPYALLALFLTAFISLTGQLSKPFSFVIGLFIYHFVATGLIVGFMSRFYELLQEDEEIISNVARLEGNPSIVKNGVVISMIFVIPFIGILFSSGYQILAFDLTEKVKKQGIPFYVGWSSTYTESDHQYISYGWKEQLVALDINLSELDGKDFPDEIRGTGSLSWQVDKDVVTRNGNSTFHNVKEFPEKQNFYYHLTKRRANDGSIYYSTEGGSAGIIDWEDKARESISLEMMVSADGENVFVLQHPTRFPSDQVFRVSIDGRFLQPSPSQMNPSDFKYFWFKDNLDVEDLLTFTEEKNKLNHISFSNNRYLDQLSVALQEADGRMVKQIFTEIEKMGVALDVPEKTEDEWDLYLEGLYKGANWKDFVFYYQKAGEQFPYDWQESKEFEGEGEHYFVTIPFPNGDIKINFTRLDGEIKVLKINILGE